MKTKSYIRAKHFAKLCCKLFGLLAFATLMRTSAIYSQNCVTDNEYYKYLPTLLIYFNGGIDCYNMSGICDPELEKYFPVRFDFDGDLDLTNNLKNYVPKEISASASGIQSAGDCKNISNSNRNQLPTVYFHKIENYQGPQGRQWNTPYNIYQYWYYFVEGHIPDQKMDHLIMKI